MKTSTTATGVVGLFLLLSSTFEPIDALSQTLIIESEVENLLPDDIDIQPETFISDKIVSREKSIHLIEKIWASLLVVDRTEDSFDWNAVSLTEYAIESNAIYEYDTDTRLLISSIFNPNVTFLYWNSKLGNKKSIKVELNDLNEMVKNWLPEKPLKVITHGYMASQENDKGVFTIKTAYVDVGDYNVITVDWSSHSHTVLYPIAAYWTKPVGEKIAKLLGKIVKLNVIKPSDIHVIGHSLGAHVAGACGDAFQSGIIGRITGLDPAGPSFKGQLLRMRTLNRKDAEFVDVIHTDNTLFGFPRSLGSVDFYPNGAEDPQPGCFIPSCSHSRAHKYYTESVYNNNSFVSVKCDSWTNYKAGACKNNEISHMGNNADPKMRGDFYLATYGNAPFSMT